jgi:disulfide bond formation protein DsbB
MRKIAKEYVIYLAWLQALVATLGSLYFSEIKHYAPCTLCWYQRILMYPLILIIAVGILLKDKNIYKYVLPMSIMGILFAFYHILIQNKVLPGTFAPCSLAASCERSYTGYFGFITIPIMSFTAFNVITFSMLLFKNLHEQRN